MIVVVIAFVLRLLMGIPLLNNPERMLQNDSPSYLKVATNLHAGNGYSNCPTAPFHKDVLRTPTYPALISTAKVISDDNRFIFLIQIFLDLFTLLLIFRIGESLFDKKAGLAACFFYALSIISVVMCAQVLAETSFVFLCVLSFYLLIIRRYYVAGGLVLGLSVLCKPIGLYLIFLYSLYFIWNKVSWKQMLATVVSFAVLVGGWMYRNQQITGTATISSISAYSLFAYNANMVVGYQTGRNESDLREERIQEVYEIAKGELADYSGEYDYIKLFDEKGKEIIKNNLGLYTSLHLKNSVTSLLPGVHYVLELFGQTQGQKGTMNILRRDGVISAAKYYFNGKWGSLVVLLPWIGVWIGMVIAATLGSIKLLVSKNWKLVILLLLPGLYFLFISGPSAEPRFGALFAPYFCLLGGFYLVSFDRIKNWL